MTGLHTGHTPVRANGKNRYLYDQDVTLAEILREQGYETGGFGKWGLGLESTPGVATRQGFNRWFGQYSQHHAHFFYPYWIWNNLDRYPLPENEGGKRGTYIFDLQHAQALEFIRQARDRPFFAYLPYIIPHVELVVPAEDEAPFRDQFPVVAMPDKRPGYIGSEHGYATYAGMVTRLDRAVGDILQSLKDAKLDEDTLIIFTSDNGAQGGGVWDQLVTFFDGTSGLRGSKGAFYEGGIRVPFIARWPGQIKAGTTSNLPIAFWDLLPTLAEITNATVQTPVDGLSFAPTLLGQGTQTLHPFFYWEYPAEKSSSLCIRMGDWKGIRSRVTSKWELYHLGEDPRETDNRATAHPEILAQLQAIAEQEHTPERDYPELDPPSKLQDFVR